MADADDQREDRLVAMTRPQSLVSNTSALLVSRGIVAVLGWTGTVLIVRHLDQVEFGQFTLVFSLLGMLSVITDMGIGRVALRGVMTEGPDQADFAGSYILLRTLLGVLGYVVAVGFVVLSDYPPVVVRATALAGLVVVVATPSHAYDIAFQAHMRMGRVAVAGVIGQVAQLALTVAIAVAGGSLLWFTVPAVLAQIVILAVKLPAARRLVSFHHTVRTDLWWAMAREALPLSIGAALATVYFRLDAIMLSRLDTFDAVAVYGVAYKFVDLIHFVSAAVVVPMLTLLVTAWPGDLAAFRETIRRAAGFLAFAAGLVLVQFGLFAEHAIALLYGDEYAEGANATRLIVSAESLAFFTSLAVAALVAAGRQRAYPLIALAGLLVNIGLNLVLIPAYSYQGAATATLATELLVLVLMWWSLLRLDGVRPLEMAIVGRFVPPAIAALAVGWSLAQFGPWLLGAVGATVAYLAAVQVLKPAGPLGLRSVLADRGAR